MLLRLLVSSSNCTEIVSNSLLRQACMVDFTLCFTLEQWFLTFSTTLPLGNCPLLQASLTSNK